MDDVNGHGSQKISLNTSMTLADVIEISILYLIAIITDKVRSTSTILAVTRGRQTAQLHSNNLRHQLRTNCD